MTLIMTEGFISVLERIDGQHFGVEEVEPGAWKSVFPKDLSYLTSMHKTSQQAIEYVREQIQYLKNRQGTT